MYMLAVDTATNSGGVALSRNSEVVGTIMLKTPLRYQEMLIELVDFLLRQHQIRLADIGCLSAATGPGSFTGLRIGLATVKALSQTLGLPCVGISTLKALAYRFSRMHPLVAPMIDARRQQVFAAVYRVEDHTLHPEVNEQVMRPQDWLKTLGSQDYLFVGDGADLYKSTVAAAFPQARILETDNRILDELCRLAYQEYAQGAMVAASELAPNYVRPSDAELSRT
ncbi:MAG: tRNA (adenosine(37)-N6)-threonylcarbamoyltransferase complex dimerization subunit type 1 TsaB [Acidobacteriota bacterium]